MNEKTCVYVQTGKKSIVDDKLLESARNEQELIERICVCHQNLLAELNVSKQRFEKLDAALKKHINCGTVQISPIADKTKKRKTPTRSILDYIRGECKESPKKDKKMAMSILHKKKQSPKKSAKDINAADKTKKYQNPKTQSKKCFDDFSTLEQSKYTFHLLSISIDKIKIRKRVIK
ncbi:hypothetical protein RFI_18959 [Reticulomyxa filosa]|uniref:Uncharacterized protein n=1 Tax=Reticulomyxa filosa TaxID=46433 RepID=X6MWD7_RETFI|nr:hypothetical protein RFI_18959 [Reticulomyxa filosa]|eukprot:ETO18318.1 hypothetical protein RFI_18959 [Reticulomyxa filosa]